MGDVIILYKVFVEDPEKFEDVKKRIELLTPDKMEDEEIGFNAGFHSELIKLPYKDFERLVKPKVAKFSRHEVS